MDYINLGRSGLKVSKLCLGTWHLPHLEEKDEYGVYKINVEEVRRIVKRAIDLGINCIDTANRYHGAMAPVDLQHVGTSERILGEVLQGFDRESLVIATKVRGQMAPWPNGEGLSRKHIMWQIRESLKRLRTDYVDLYQMHWPDPSTPIEESMEAMADLVHRGLVNYIGASNFPADAYAYMSQLARELHVPFVSMQELYNWLERDNDAKLETAKRYGLSVLAYSPLAQGFLTGKYLSGVPQSSRATYMPDLPKRYMTPERLEAVKRFHEVAQRLGVKDSQLALAWILKRAEEVGVAIVPIIGATRTEQLEENVEAVSINLKWDVYRELEDIYSALRAKATG
ncbi:MAG: aldo/keto reductase [Thermoproteus sp. AZ2]|uniref:Aldo/keto reductase n=1 Tax=Thermoproteus sp. AZ2 TaxID=1609232 RepID=A0ACC6UYZ9_9CREN